MESQRTEKSLEQENRIAKVGYGHQCPREENLTFNNNYIIYKLYFNNNYI